MTADVPISSAPVGYTTAAEGCTVCGTQQTETLSGLHGRRCAAHPAGFDPNTAVAILMAGWPGAAAAYVRAWAT